MPFNSQMCSSSMSLLVDDSKFASMVSNPIVSNIRQITPCFVCQVFTRATSFFRYIATLSMSSSLCIWRDNPKKGGMDKFGTEKPLLCLFAFEFASNTAPHSVSPTTCDSQSSSQLRYNMLKHQLSTQTRHTNHKCTAWLFDVSPCFTLFHQVLGWLSCLALSNFRHPVACFTGHWLGLNYRCLIYLVPWSLLVMHSSSQVYTQWLSVRRIGTPNSMLFT